MKGDKGKNSGGKKKSVFELLNGKEVTLQLLRGVIINGTFAGVERNYFVLSNATIIGSKHTCKTPLCLVKVNQVQHMHLKGEVIPKDEQQKT